MKYGNYESTTGGPARQYAARRSHRPILQFTAILPLILAACSPVAPEDRLTLTIEVDRVSADVGDTVRVLGIAYNPTAETVSAGRGCSPGIGFWATPAGGSEVDLYDGLAFNCPLRDDQSISPNETDSVFFHWVPETAGSWMIRAAIVGDGPRSPSSPAAVTVR